MNKLEFDSIQLEFGAQTILKSIYMKCFTGSIVGLLGRNGCGKSCILRSVFGTMKIENKSIRFNNQPLLGNYLKKRIISYLPQDILLPSFLTFSDALDFFEIDFCKMACHFPELVDVLPRKSTEVSGGQRRLFEVLLILYSHHPFSFFDEPFTGIMPLHVEKLSEIFIQEKNQKGIIITDHLHRSIRSICDSLYVLANGQTYPILREEQLLKFGYLSEL